MCIRLESKLDTTTAGVGLFNKHTADWVIHWWICFVSIAFLLLTWIRELKAGCLYVLCPNITTPCTLSPALVRIMSQKQGAQHSCWGKSKGYEENRLRPAGRQKGKRYANTTMTSSLREEKEGCEWGEQSHVENTSERKCNTRILPGKKKKQRNYVADLEKTI